MPVETLMGANRQAKYWRASIDSDRGEAVGIAGIVEAAAGPVILSAASAEVAAGRPASQAGNLTITYSRAPSKMGENIRIISLIKWRAPLARNKFVVITRSLRREARRLWLLWRKSPARESLCKYDCS